MQIRGLRGEKQALFYQGDVSKSIRYEDSDNVHADRIRVVGAGRCIGMPSPCVYAARDFREWSQSGVEDDWPLVTKNLGALLRARRGNDRRVRPGRRSGNLAGRPPLPASAPLALHGAHPSACHQADGHSVIPVRKAVLTSLTTAVLPAIIAAIA